MHYPDTLAVAVACEHASPEKDAITRVMLVIYNSLLLLPPSPKFLPATNYIPPGEEIHSGVWWMPACKPRSHAGSHAGSLGCEYLLQREAN